MARLDVNNIKAFFKKTFNKRTLKYGSNSIILIAVVVTIAVVINLLVGMADLKWDLTSNKLFSIGDETKKILESNEKDVEIYGLFDESLTEKNTTLKQIAEILNQYAKYDHIKIIYKDPDTAPGLLREISPSEDKVKELEDADFVVKCGNKIKTLDSYDLYDVQFDQYSYQTDVTGIKAEQAFTGAIKYVTSDYTPTVYFTEGHQENKVDDYYETVKIYLDQNNYAVKTVNLMTQEEVPSDAEILIIASPKTDLSTDEEYKIKQYLKNGGKVLFLFDSLESDVKFTAFENVLADYNISLNYDKVKENDESRHIPQNPYDILPEIQSNTINSNLNPGNFFMIMPVSRSLKIMKNEKEYLNVYSLMKTSDKAVGEIIGTGEQEQGPLDLAVAAEYTGGRKVSKVVVMGNSSFMSDDAINRYGTLSNNGMYFFLNSLNWMQDRKDDVTIAPKSFDTRYLSITETQANIAAVFVVFVLPILIFGTGLFVWIRRRHL
jgi:ABC-2 type transport system permease protein